MESATLQHPGCAIWFGGARYEGNDSTSLHHSLVQRRLKGFGAKSVGRWKSASPAFEDFESWRPLSSRESCMSPPHAIYRHGRLECVESVFEGNVLVEGAISEDQDDLTALSELYLASGNWDNTASLKSDHQTLTLDLMQERAQAEQAIRAHSHSAASSSEVGPSVGGSMKQDARDPLREKQKFVADMLSNRGADSSNRGALKEGPEVRDRQESLDIRLGGARPFSQTAKRWHEIIEGGRPGDTGLKGDEQEQSVESRNQESCNPKTERRADSQFEKSVDSPFARRRMESGQQDPGFESIRQKPSPRRQYGYASLGAAAGEVQSMPKMRQREPWEASRRAQQASSRAQQAFSRAQQVKETAGQRIREKTRKEDKDESDILQGLFLGKPGWRAVIAAILRWTERLTRVMSSLVTKSLPQSMPRQSIEHVVNGALAIGVIWVCKAALQVALTLGATVCCLFVISRVFWDLSVSTALSGSSQDRFTARETDERGSRQERETVWLNAAGSRRESSSGGRPDAERVFRSGRASRYAEDDKNRQRSGRKSSRIADFLQQQAELVGGKARTFLARVIGSDVDVLQMFDMGRA